MGHTHRHHSTRVEEHFGKDKLSHVLKHLKSNRDCENVCDDNCFTIIDTASTQYQLIIKEALHIRWIKPNLNIQKNHYNLTLLF